MGKTLIIGKGFIGSALCRNPDSQVINISRNQLDYTDKYVFQQFLKRNDFHTVINCVGYTGTPNVDACEINKEECYHYNVTIPCTIQEIVRENNKYANYIHIGSGCIYDGYDKDYTELDTPNFGMFSDKSSFYSKTKHISENILKQDTSTAIVRIRIPFDSMKSSKNYFNKLLKYDNLIDFKNSRTSIPKLATFISMLRSDFMPGIYNAVHDNPLSTSSIVNLMKSYGFSNPNWKFVEYNQIPIVANRSNCVLSTKKIEECGLSMGDEYTAVKQALVQYGA